MSDEKILQELEEELREEFTEEEVAEGMNVTAAGKKKVIVPGLGTVYLHTPTRDDELEADFERSRAFTRFLSEGLKTENELAKILEGRGIWTSADDKKMEDLISALAEKQIEYRAAKQGGSKWKRLRQEMLRFAKSNRAPCPQTVLFAHTVEVKAQCLQELPCSDVYDEGRGCSPRMRVLRSLITSRFNPVGRVYGFYNGLLIIFDLLAREKPNSKECSQMANSL